MYFGHGVYGVQAASQLYFGKPAKDLTLEEAALIAGILQGNVRQSPYVNMDAAMRRRNYTLGGWRRSASSRAAEAEEAKKKPIVLRGEPSAAAIGRALLPRRSPQGARRPLRRQAALRERPVDPDGARRRRCRRRPTARWTRGCGASTSGAASGSRGATSSPKATQSRRSEQPRWERPMRGRRHRSGRGHERPTAPRSQLRAGALARHDRSQGVRLDAARRPRRSW